MNFNIGDKVNLISSKYKNANNEGYIIDYDIDTKLYLLFLPDWQIKNIGHRAWSIHKYLSVFNQYNISIPNNNNTSGSWWVHKDEIKFIINFSKPENKYWNVCNKINQMENRRKEQGYAF